MGVCQTKNNNPEIVNQNSIVSHNESNKVLMLKKGEEEKSQNDDNNNQSVSILKLKAAPPRHQSQAVHHVPKVRTRNGLMSVWNSNSKTKVRLFFKAYGRNGVIFVTITNWTDISSRLDMNWVGDLCLGGYVQDIYFIQFKLPSKSQWDSFTLKPDEPDSDALYNHSFRFRVPVELYSFEIKLKIKCNIQWKKSGSMYQDYYIKHDECMVSKTVRIKVKPYSFESLKGIGSNDMMRVRKETRERMNKDGRNESELYRRDQFDGIVFETFSMGSALKCMVGKVDHHSVKGDIIKGINTGLKGVFESKSERYFIGFQIFKYCEVPDYDYYIQCISSKSHVELTYAWNEYLTLAPKLYHEDKMGYGNGYHPQTLLFDTSTKESIFKCHLCETRIKWFDYIFVCGCNEDDQFGAHRYCVLCLYIIYLQYQKLNQCVMDVLDGSIDKYLIDEIVSCCLGDCKVKQLKI